MGVQDADHFNRVRSQAVEDRVGEAVERNASHFVEGELIEFGVQTHGLQGRFDMQEERIGQGRTDAAIMSPSLTKVGLGGVEQIDSGHCGSLSKRRFTSLHGLLVDLPASASWMRCRSSPI